MEDQYRLIVDLLDFGDCLELSLTLNIPLEDITEGRALYVEELLSNPIYSN